MDVCMQAQSAVPCDFIPFLAFPQIESTDGMTHLGSKPEPFNCQTTQQVGRSRSNPRTVFPSVPFVFLTGALLHIVCLSLITSSVYFLSVFFIFLFFLFLSLNLLLKSEMLRLAPICLDQAILLTVGGKKRQKPALQFEHVQGTSDCDQ